MDTKLAHMTTDKLPEWVSGRDALLLEAQGKARRTGLRDQQGRYLVEYVVRSEGK